MFYYLLLILFTDNVAGNETCKSAAPKTLTLECPFMHFECSDYDDPDPYLYFELFSQKWDSVMKWIAYGKDFKKLTAGTVHDITSLTDGDLGSLNRGPDITKLKYKWTGTDVLLLKNGRRQRYLCQ